MNTLTHVARIEFDPARKSPLLSDDKVDAAGTRFIPHDLLKGVMDPIHSVALRVSASNVEQILRRWEGGAEPSFANLRVNRARLAFFHRWEWLSALGLQLGFFMPPEPPMQAQWAALSPSDARKLTLLSRVRVNNCKRFFGSFDLLLSRCSRASKLRAVFGDPA